MGDEYTKKLQKSKLSCEIAGMSTGQECDKLAHIIDSLIDGVLVVDHNNNIRFSNLAAQNIFDLYPVVMKDIKFEYSVSEGPYEVELPVGEKKQILQISTVPIMWDNDSVCLVVLRDVKREELTTSEIRELSQHIVEAQERQCRRISHELHDKVGGALAAIKLMVARVEKRCGAMCGDEVEKVKRLLDNTIDIVGALSLDMWSDILDEYGLPEALKWYLEKFTSQTGIVVNLNLDLYETKLPSIVEGIAYRIIQTFLTEVTLNSPLKVVNVTIHSDNKKMYIRFEDLDRNFNFEEMNAECLPEIQDRVLLGGGKMFVDLSHNKGGCVICELPLGGL